MKFSILIILMASIFINKLGHAQDIWHRTSDTLKYNTELVLTIGWFKNNYYDTIVVLAKENYNSKPYLVYKAVYFTNGMYIENSNCFNVYFDCLSKKRIYNLTYYKMPY